MLKNVVRTVLVIATCFSSQF